MRNVVSETIIILQEILEMLGINTTVNKFSLLMMVRYFYDGNWDKAYEKLSMEREKLGLILAKCSDSDTKNKSSVSGEVNVQS